MGRNIFLGVFLKIFLHFPPWIRTSRGAEGGPLWTPRFSSSRGAVQRSRGAAAYPGSMVIRALGSRPKSGSRPKGGARRGVKWGAKGFLEIFIFSHLFVNWIKILFSSYHCSRSSPLNCQRAKLIKILTSRGNVTPTLRGLHASPRKCQNVPLNDGPSPDKLISLLCSSLLTPCSSLQSRRALQSPSQADYVVTRSLTKFGDRALVFTRPG